MQDFPGSAVLQGIDKAGNACPSLHVATAAFSAVWLHRILCQMGEGRIAKGVNMAWGIAIILSTITTRQHVFLDLVAGVALPAE